MSELDETCLDRVLKWFVDKELKWSFFSKYSENEGGRRKGLARVNVKNASVGASP